MNLYQLLISVLLLAQTIPLLHGKGFAGWVDPDTPIEYRQITSMTDGKVYDIVMSDEFNVDKRSFKDGYDPTWTAIDKSDDDQTSQGKKSLQFYNSSNIYTSNGNLVIETNTEDTKWKGWNPYQKKYEVMQRHFKSGMLQSWNKFCYTGGILEVDVKFPGRHDVGGLWPAVWLMGNLGRATFEASTNLMWPWSYSKCNRELQRAQEISGCDSTSHYDLDAGRGRGATEIDIIEIMAGPAGKLPIVKNDVQRPYTSMTLQVAPGIPASKKRPPAGTLPEWGFHWYSNLTYGPDTSINPFFYGTYLAATKTQEPVFRTAEESYQCDAISSMMTIDKSYFETMHTFRFEWQPGDDGYVHWYVDGKLRFGVEAAGLREQESKIPNEPSYVIFNTAISTSWGFPSPPWGCTEYDCKKVDGRCGFSSGFCQTLPAKFLIDHVRIYQNKDDPRQTIGCNPRDYPTKAWIKGHEFRYTAADTAKSLKDIKSGGGKCATSSDCGTNGKCILYHCLCDSDHVGPNCLVPNYHNDFPDWSDEKWYIISEPYIPRFLIVSAIFLAVLLIFAVYVVQRKHTRPAFGTSSHQAYDAIPSASATAAYSPVYVQKTPTWF